MITKMSKYTLLSPSSYSEEFIARLQDTGVMDIRRSHRPIDGHSSALLDRATALKEEMAGTQLKNSLGEKGRTAESLHRELSAAGVWGEYDNSTLDKLFREGCEIRFHRISSKKYDAGWESEYPMSVIEDDGKNTFFVTIGSTPLPGEIEAPRPLAEIKADMERNEKEIAGLKAELDALPAKNVTLQKEYDDIMAELDAYLAHKSEEAEKKAECPEDLGRYIDIYEGFAPASELGTITAELDKLPVYYIVEDAVDDDTPIKLRNNWFTRQFEVFTGMYGMPVYGEFDPTPILAPFYLLFFSMCMGDAGYGILLMLIAWLLGKKMPQSGLGSMHSLIFLLGAGTFAVGLVLGTFFGISLYDAAWVPAWMKRCMLVEGNIGKIAGFDPQMVLALAIGVFHVCLAMIVKTACFTKHYGFRNCLSTWGWTILIVGGVIVAALVIGGSLGGQALKYTVIGLGAVSALGIFIFNNPDRNPLVNIGAGLWDAYSTVSGLLSDVLSYIRLYALGLAGGMLGGVFNDLAGMILGENPTWQWLPFLILLLVGHGLNIALSSLGAFVHPLRLTFVEYFKNSGYEGKGVEYRPLSKKENK